MNVKSKLFIVGIYCSRPRDLSQHPKMNYRTLIEELVASYSKHGWKLRRVLLQPATRQQLDTEGAAFGDGVSVNEAEVDALWFSRPSHEQREAWELRLISENAFALFETFELDEAEEDREDVRREMEARMREKL